MVIVYSRECQSCDDKRVNSTVDPACVLNVRAFVHSIWHTHAITFIQHHHFVAGHFKVLFFLRCLSRSTSRKSIDGFMYWTVSCPRFVDYPCRGVYEFFFRWRTIPACIMIEKAFTFDLVFHVFWHIGYEPLNQADDEKQQMFEKHDKRQPSCQDIPEGYCRFVVRTACFAKIPITREWEYLQFHHSGSHTPTYRQ